MRTTENGTKTLPDCLQDTRRLSSRHPRNFLKTLSACLQDNVRLCSRRNGTVFKTPPDSLQAGWRVSSRRNSFARPAYICANLRIKASSADGADLRRWRAEAVGKAGVRTVAHGFTRGETCMSDV